MTPTRRTTLRGTGLLALATATGGAGAPGYPPPQPADVGAIRDGRLSFPNWRGAADPPSEPLAQPLPPDQRVGFAIVGLGRIALEQALPAFAECRQARPVALVSGSPDKARLVARQYGIPDSAVFGYEQLERLADHPEVRAAYIALPNALHREFTERLAGIGKHVLSEKPMATSSADAAAMIAACARAKVRLMIAYRCQYEQVNRAAIALVRSGALGHIRVLQAANVQLNGPTPQWRYSHALAGGGSLPDIGLYCLNAFRAYTDEEPVEASAWLTQPADDPRFHEVECSVAFTLRFPSGLLAQGLCSYDAYQDRSLRVLGDQGGLELANAFDYRGQRLRLLHRAGEHGVVEEPRIEPRNQFALEIDHFADCVLHDRQPHTPGEEGLRDHLVMEAIYRSAAEGGRPIAIAPPAAGAAIRGPAPSAG